MITFSKSYKTSDLKLFGSIEEAQTHEISLLLKGNKKMLDEINSTVKLGSIDISYIFPIIANYIINNRDLFLDILTTTPNSKPKARAVHGGTKNRKKTCGVGVITDANASIDSNINNCEPIINTIPNSSCSNYK